MFCPQCGNEQAGPINFCCQCGAAMGGAQRPKAKLALSAEDSKIAGVCGGFAEYLGVDATLVRLAWVMLAFLGGWGLIGYAVAWLIMPSEKSKNEDAAAVKANAATAAPN